MGFGVIITLMIAANIYTLYMLFTISSTAKATLTSEVRSIDFSKQLQTLLYEQERNAEKYWISHDRTYFDLLTDGAARSNLVFDSLLSVQTDSTPQQMIRNLKRTHSWYLSKFTLANNHRGTKSNEKKNLPEQAILTDSLEKVQSSLNNLINLSQESIDYSMTNVEEMTSRS